MTMTTSLETEELYGFRDSAADVWLRFYSPARRYDLWEAYVDGARRTYQRFNVESALTLPPVTRVSETPIFSVVTDEQGSVIAGAQINGPLTSLSQAYAPREFVGEPQSAALIAQRIFDAIPEGVFEIKGVWVDPSAGQKVALADVMSRSFVHAMYFLRVRHAFCTAAEHAAPRWCNSGGRPVPGVVPTPYPDERYRTTALWWDQQTWLQFATTEQAQLFVEESLWATGLNDMEYR